MLADLNGFKQSTVFPARARLRPLIPLFASLALGALICINYSFHCLDWACSVKLCIVFTGALDTHNFGFCKAEIRRRRSSIQEVLGVSLACARACLPDWLEHLDRFLRNTRLGQGLPEPATEEATMLQGTTGTPAMLLSLWKP